MNERALRETGGVPDRSYAADELGIAQALNTRTRGVGSLSMVLRIAVATTVSWFVAQKVSASVLPIFAPATTLLVVQASPFSTLGMLAQRVLGTGLGVAAATVYVTYVPIAWWSVLLAIAAALLAARALPVGVVGQLQIPVAVVFVLALGPGDLQTDLWRVFDVVIGGLIGVVAVFVAPPRPRVAEAAVAVDDYLRAISSVLRAAARDVGQHAVPLPSTTRHAFVGDARALLAYVGGTEEALAEAVESVKFNPRARRLDDELERIGRRRLWGLILATQTRALVGSIDRLYDREGTPPALPAQALAPLVVSLADLLDLVAREGGRDRVRAASDALADDLRAAVSATTDHREVVDVLDSVTLLGRLDQLRGLVAHGPRREDPMSGPADPLDDEDADELALTYGERVRRLLGRG